MLNITPKISVELERLKGDSSLFFGLGKHVRFNKNDYIQKSGDSVKYFYYMTSGIVKCFYTHDDKEVVLRLMTGGSAVLGYSGFVTGGPSTENIQCVQPCEGLLIPIEKIEALRANNPKMDLVLRYIAEQHYLSLERRLMMLHHKSARERYQFFCATMEEAIVNETPMHCVASYLGVTPESFSRMKRALNN